MTAATISFSGGRTSAFMLHEMMRRGQLGPDVHVLFSNTGREREETLRFVQRVQLHWDVKIHWLELDWRPATWPAFSWGAPTHGVREVNFFTAARDGEPFEALIRKRKWLPNPVARYCTQELKIRVMREWMKAHGYEHWTNFVGIRADEPRRSARLLDPEKQRKERFEVALPMVEWGTTLADVEAFWETQPFKLELKPHEGNCDLCFLKTADKRVLIARERPDLAQWWHDQESRVRGSFRKEGTLAQLMVLAEKRELDAARQGDLFTCFCGDDAEAA